MSVGPVRRYVGPTPRRPAPTFPMSSPTSPLPDAQAAWARFERWLGDHLPALADDLADGAAEADLDALAERTGLALPDAVRAVYRRHDGQRTPVPGLFFGLQFLSAREAGDEWGRWAELVRGDPALTDDVDVTASPEGAVRPVYFSEGWLPVASDGAGNHLAVDLDPGPAGTAGQVVTFGADEPVRLVVAPSVADFVGWCARVCEGGEATVVPDPGGRALLLSGGRTLLDAAPALFGPG